MIHRDSSEPDKGTENLSKAEIQLVIDLALFAIGLHFVDRLIKARTLCTSDRNPLLAMLY